MNRTYPRGGSACLKVGLRRFEMTGEKKSSKMETEKT